MAAVLGQFSWPFSRRAEVRTARYMPLDSKVLELQTAKEILAEIFEIDIPEVEQMIRQRREDAEMNGDSSHWPERLWVDVSFSDA
jgi:hypothetical protein